MASKHNPYSQQITEPFEVDELHQKALMGQWKALGEDDVLTQNDVFRSLYLRTGLHNDALDHYNRALAALTRRTRGVHPETADIAEAIARVYWQKQAY